MSEGETVYVIDDDVASAMSLQAVLDVNEFETEVFESAEAFLEALSRVAPDACIVLDQRLPGMSGLELQRELIQRGCTFPIVMISGHADQQSVSQAIQQGAAAFLQKPFSGKELCEAIENATQP